MILQRQQFLVLSRKMYSFINLHQKLTQHLTLNIGTHTSTFKVDLLLYITCMQFKHLLKLVLNNKNLKLINVYNKFFFINNFFKTFIIFDMTKFFF